MKSNLKACSISELLKSLSVLRLQAAKQAQVVAPSYYEEESMRCFLSAFSADALFVYPLELIGSCEGKNCESPDFRLILREQRIGVEHTRAGPRDLSWALKLAENTPDAVVELSQFSPDFEIPRRSGRKPYIVSADVPLRGSGFQGNQREEYWVKYHIAAINKKTELLSAPAFTQFEENWLLISDCTLLGGTNLNEAMLMLSKNLEPYWTRADGFSNIFIETNKVIIHLTAGLSRQQPIINA